MSYLPLMMIWHDLFIKKQCLNEKAAKDEILVKYALGSITNQLFVSKYQIYLPEKDLLERELRDLLNEVNP